MPPASVNQFLCRFWGVASESSKIPLSVHLSFQTNTENTTNPDVTPPRFCTLCSSVPPVSNLDFTRLPPAFFPSVRLLSSKFHIAVQQRGWLRRSHQNIPLCARGNQLAELFVSSSLCCSAACIAIHGETDVLLMESAPTTDSFAVCAIPQYLNLIPPHL